MIQTLRRLMFAAGLLASLGFAAPGQAQVVAPVSAEDFVLGNPKAKVTVIEYASAACPHCARFANDVFPAFKAKYVDTGKVYYVYRPFLTEPVQVAGAAAMVEVCSGRTRAFSVIAAFFKGQQHMYDTNDLKTNVLAAGAAGGLSEAQVMACLNDATATAALEARVKRYVNDDKIASTPTFVLGDQRLEGEQTLAVLDTAVAKAQTKAVGGH